MMLENYLLPMNIHIVYDIIITSYGIYPSKYVCIFIKAYKKRKFLETLFLIA